MLRLQLPQLPQLHECTRFKPLPSLPLNFARSALNIALNQTAYMSSTASAAVAAGATSLARYALDGDPATFSHTNNGDTQNVLSIDLGYSYSITRIVIRNRPDW